ncbi:hypothetical protein [Draconibacterium halophilum]|jgi:hypothetical protein|uniref:Uncharacterized protein n=1 Tax=Draconibacterium halophilum TaxID=2706887 RepID=A0A6C0RDS0_9BACT|nr:hypothetical protein [Draconibacterium halophilum]QIA08789.1 hypothetical protein G0Q07_14145 [Draconibacterium halophilum]QIA08808.1 hypothetical protein G0Q07_14245 [Draconibacterium halophilum]
MDDLKKIFRFFTKENISITLLIIYSISFVNYYLYYKSFNIPVFNYLSIPDLVYFPLEYIFQIVLIILIYEIFFFIVFSIFWTIYERIVLIIRKKFFYYLRLDKTQKARITDLFEKPFKNGLTGSKFIIALLGVFFIGYLPNKLLFIPAYFVYFIYLTEIMSDKKMLNISIPMVTVIIILCMIFTTLYNSYTKRFEKDEYLISFIENNEFITTEKCKSNLNYLGETSTNIFLYDIENKVSKIYSKSKITNLEIQNTSSLDDIILKIRDFYPIKIFREMLNE